MADENYIDLYKDDESGKVGTSIAGKDVVLLDAPEVLLSPDTPLLTNAQDVAGAINELFQSGGEGGDDWALPENWINIPEPKQNQIVILIEVPADRVNNLSYPALGIGSSYGFSGGSVDWGDGYVDNMDYSVDDKYAHIYSKAGLYIVTINCSDNMQGISLYYSSLGQSHVSGDIIPGGEESKHSFSMNQAPQNIWVRAVKFGNNTYISLGSSQPMKSMFQNIVYVKYCGNSFDFVYNKTGLFTNCWFLCKIDFEVLPSEIPASMCSACYSLKTIDFAKNVKNIPSAAFYNCYGILKADLLSAESMEYNSLSGCYMLKEINAPKLTRMADQSFRDCYGLRKFSAAMLTSIPAYIFYYAYNLEEIDTPSLMDLSANSYIGYCYSLKKFTYADGCNFNGIVFNNLPALYPKPE